MATIELAYVKAYKDRHGKPRHYYRRKGFPTLPLPGLPGSAEFMAAYAAADARAPKLDPLEKVQPRSINALIVEYYRSAAFKKLKPSTQANYRNILDRFRAKHGDKGVASVETKHFEGIFHAMADTPGAARNLRKRLSKVFRLAVRLGWRTGNPVRDTEVEPSNTGGFTSWSEEEIARFEAHWPSGSRERLAMALLLYTGVRRSDVVGLGRQHVADGRISVTQEKTAVRIRIPIHPTLQTELAGRSGLTFLLTQYGKPFSAAGFTAWFVARAEKAGVVGRTPHGLRKAAGRRLAEAGATTKQIAAVLGHASLDEAETYTRDADQSRLADAAFAHLLEAETGTRGV